MLTLDDALRDRIGGGASFLEIRCAVREKGPVSYTHLDVYKSQLLITARKAQRAKKEYTSARLVTRGKADWTYGRIEIRAKLTKGRGTGPAGWMLGSNM